MTAGGALSRPELDELLRRPLLARLATNGPDGYPRIVPVWIAWDGGAAWIVARALAGFVSDIRRDPHVCLSLVAEDDPDRRVQILGLASIVEGPSALDGRMLEIALATALRYEGPAGIEYVERSRSWPRCLVRIDPERVRSWASPDWHPRYVTPAPGGAP